MLSANQNGFLPGNDAFLNAQAFQKTVDNGGKIFVEAPGVYDLSETVEIGSNTKIYFGDGVQIRRHQSRTGRNGNAFLNKGALTHTYDYNISLIGLHLDCNGVESADLDTDSRYVGLRAQVGMIYVKNLVVDDFKCIGLLSKDYALQISAFDQIRLENLYVCGNKDGVHLGWGKDFVIRHGKFCTYDDPIALNAFDYARSNTHVGWIENGLIEDCWDLADDTTTGHFCRMLGGAWCDWYDGMQVQNSDTVCFGGRVYRAVLRPDGATHTSTTPPTHDFGLSVVDGIPWVCVRDEAVYDCGCRNIVLRDIKLQKKRNHRAISVALNMDAYARSYVKNCNPVPMENIVMENIAIETEIPELFGADYPIQSVRLADTDLKDAKLRFDAFKYEGLTYPTAVLTLENVIAKPDSIISAEGHPVRIVTAQEQIDKNICRDENRHTHRF